jgi:alpha-L-arabinofuranosidase
LKFQLQAVVYQNVKNMIHNIYLVMSKKRLFLLCIIIPMLCRPVVATVNNVHNEPDSAYIFAYGTDANRNKNGLHFAWSIDRKNWHAIGPEHTYIRCDYGRWDSQKRMIAPFLFHGPDGTWHCVWALNETDGAFAHAASDNLIYWKSQSYPVVMQNNNCLFPEIAYDKTNREYIVSWLGTNGSSSEAFYTTTRDFKTYVPTKKYTARTQKSRLQDVPVSGKMEKGTMHKVAWANIDALIKTQQLAAYKRQLWAENTGSDRERFAQLEPVKATITVEAPNSKKISDLLVGIFFEDINYGADGGLYAELIQNRDFEYALSDKEGKDKSWNSYKAWSVSGDRLSFSIDTLSPVHPNNRHYAVLRTDEPGARLVNEGFDGIALKAGEKYDFSVFARMPAGKNGKLTVRLIDKNGKNYGEASVKAIGSEWKKYSAVLTAKETINEAFLELIPQTAGSLALDMVSLFPQKTFKGRKNGLRADLAQTIADIRPRFVRFPGGCVAHGDGLGNMYRWKNTVGPLESRVPQRNLWGYHQTAGLGYFEYFQFCEDIGAEPLPVVPAGVPCQNSATGGGGQQGGIPMDEMDDYVQEILDLIEWANGDAKTEWGRKRAEAGHPEPFNLKYIGIGNEDLITDVFEERFTMIFNAVREKHPEITVIGTVGPFFEGADYVEGWKIADRLNVPMVDEHYYQTPGWFIHNQDFYDRYDRSKSKVYLGEYAAHLPGRPNNVETALAEALYLTTLERNGDVVSMTSYAPLLAKEGHTQWNPDLIYFNNTEVKPTVGYYVQQLFGQNSGNEYLSSTVNIFNRQEAVKKRIAVSFVRDSKSNDLIIKMVNLLPVEVQSTVDLKGFDIADYNATKTVLQGKPDDKNAKPVKSACPVSETFVSGLPAYSLTVIRVKMK